MHLRDIYLQALAACDPALLVRNALIGDEPRNVVAIGKCAGALMDGVATSMLVKNALVIVPEGYAPSTSFETIRGGHPHITSASFEAGRRVLRFVREHDDILFLISGGGSACAEVPLPPFDEDDVMRTNARLVRSALPIADINCVRKHLSAIKGGRLGAAVRGRSVTCIYSDVSDGALADVASGPTLPDVTSNEDAARILERLGDCDRIVTLLRHPSTPDSAKRTNTAARLVADNNTLTAAAASIAARDGWVVVRWQGQIESDVDEAAHDLAERVSTLEKGELLVAGGEPTVVVSGSGKGGRCSELALRFALHCEVKAEVLFASSDGVDGNSGAAGVELKLPLQSDEIREALARSDSFPLAARLGGAIMIPPTGNNLRDLFLLART